MGTWQTINTNKSLMCFLSPGKKMAQVAMEHHCQRNLRHSKHALWHSDTGPSRQCSAVKGEKTHRGFLPCRCGTNPAWHVPDGSVAGTAFTSKNCTKRPEISFSDVHQPDTEDTLVPGRNLFSYLSIIYCGEGRLEDMRRYIISPSGIIKCYLKQNHVLRDSQASL